MEEKIRDRIYDFFAESNDFNGIPLRNISEEFKIGYEESIDLLKKLVIDKSVSIQSSTNPHIIGFQHYPLDSQLKILESAKSITADTQDFGEISISFENTEYPICLYPSQDYIKSKRDIKEFGTAEYTKLLALGEPHLSPKYFEIEVLERYSNDPRFDFKFSDYSGSISCKYDEHDNPIVREEDQVFLKTFGLGFDDQGNRLAVVYLRYLKDLTAEHQQYWKSKEVIGNCKILKEYHDNTIQGQWTFSYSMFSAFIGELNAIIDLTEKAFGVSVFRKKFDKENRPKEFTFFFSPTLRNYHSFILLLDKMVSENINKDFFKGRVELHNLETIEDGLVERKNKGTLQLFEEWLNSVYSPNNADDMSGLFRPLKKIRRERQEPAHRISDNYYDKKFIEKQKKTISEVYGVFYTLRKIFQEHPKAKDVELPEWLDKGEIKNF